MTRILVTLGVILIVVGLAWPWLAKLGLGPFTGEIENEREHFRFYFPITTMVLVSLVVSLIFWLFRK